MKKLFSLLTLALLTMSAWAANSYVKVTATSDLTSGDYLIVCETAGVAFNGGLSSLDVTSNTIAVTISNGEIAADATTNAAIFTYDSEAKSLKSASGLYIGRTASSNGISTSATEAITNEISFDNDGNATIASGGRNLRFNNANDQKRFRYFASAQTAVQLYKLTGDGPVVTVAAPSLPAACTFTDTYTVNITNNEEGADLYYSTDGLAWTPGNSVTINETTTVYAKATKDGIDSQVVSATYTKVEPVTGNVIVFNYADDEAFTTARAYTVTRPGASFSVSSGMINGHYRIYKNQTITFNSTAGNIIRIEFDGVSGNPVSNFGEVTGMTYDGVNGTWVGSAQTVTFTASVAQVRCTEIRVYVDGEIPAIVVAAPTLPAAQEFYESLTVAITNNDADATLYYSYDNTNWTLYTEPLVLTATTTVYAKATKDGIDSQVVSATYTKVAGHATVANIAEGNALEDGTTFTFTGSAVVCFKHNKNMWIRDASGSVQVYGSANWGDEFAKGVVITPNWDGKKATYNGMHEYTDLVNFTASNQTETVEPFVRETLTADNANEYVVLQNVTIDSTYTSGGKTNYVTNTGIVARNNFNISFTPEEGVAYNIVGVVSMFNEVPQLYITEVLGYVAPVAEPNDLAEANALGDNTKFTYANDVAATYQNGKYLFIRDEAGNSGLIFGAIDATFETGDVLGADWSATKTTYNGVPEFINPEGVNNSDDQWEVAPYERQSLSAANVNEYVIMKGLSVIAETDTTVSHYTQKYYTVADSMMLYDQFGVHPTFEEDKTYDVIGIATIFNNNPQLYIISVTEGTTPQPVEPEAGDYVKVTNTADLTSGEYLIVYEDGSLAFDGGLETLDAVGNTIAVEIIDNNLIKANAEADAAVFTYDAEAGTLMSASGLYIGRTTDTNGMETSAETALTNTLSIDENGDADIVAEGAAHLRYNAASNQTRFRYFKSSTYTAQKAIQLYKKVEGETTVVRGDATGEGEVNMDDLTALINYLTDNSNPINMAGAAVCDSLDSTEVNMDDLTALINFLLTNAWAN